jgi:hypothetical protein
MTLQEYKDRSNQEEDWAPGWDAIDEALKVIYNEQNPYHFGTDFHKRATLGGNEYLDGYSIYESEHGYKHLITYGMTELYINEESFGGEWSGWGYEMTIKLKENSVEDCVWAINMMSNLARFTYTNKRFFEPMSIIPGNGESLHIGTESFITALLVIEDTEIVPNNSVHGKVEFIQLVGITQKESELIRENHQNIDVLISRIKETNPYLYTDMNRRESYL